MHLDLEHLYTSFLEPALDEFQAWTLENPQEKLSEQLLPILTFVEGLLANEPTYLDAKRRSLGPNFCCAGQVVMGKFAAIETALTSPQARTWRLGTSILDATHGPNLDVGGRNVFLLSLSDEAAGGNGDHEAFRRCMQRYIFNEAASDRQGDATARGLIARLAVDYGEMPHGAGEEFFTDVHRGWMGFLVRYTHYVLFGLNPADTEAIDLLTDLHYVRLSPTYYLAGIGSTLGKYNLHGHGDLPDLIERAATIYDNSPALADFQENDPGFNAMTRRELAKLMTAIVGIAALQGPLHLGYTAWDSVPYRPTKNSRLSESTRPNVGMR